MVGETSMKKGDLVSLNKYGVDTYGVTSCIFLGYSTAFGVTYPIALIGGIKEAVPPLFLGRVLNEKR